MVQIYRIKDILLSVDPSGDVQVKALPIQFISGSGTASVALRFGIRLALDFSAFGDGFSLESGVYADVPAYEAKITLDPTASCELAFTEEIYVDVAVFASAAVTIDGVDIGAGPKYVTTLATLELPETCIASTITGLPELAIASSSAVLASTIPPDRVTITTYYVPSSLATPIVGPYIVGTPVVNPTSLGSVPSASQNLFSFRYATVSFFAV